MKKLVIIGASGHGKVIADIAVRNGYEEIVFLDDDENVTECAGFPVVGKTIEASSIDGDKIVAIGNSKIRERIQKNIDNIADNIALGNGKFPNHFKPNSPDFNPETPFSTRFFTVDYNEFGEIIRVNLEAIHAVDEEEAKVLAGSIKNRKNGWIVNYRYNVYERNMGKTIVFIDGSMDRSSLARTLFINFIIFMRQKSQKIHKLE